MTDSPTVDEPEAFEEPRELDYYELLGVSREAGTKEIRDAYLSKARKCHPDRNVLSSEDELKDCQEQFNLCHGSLRALWVIDVQACYEIDQSSEEVTDEQYEHVAQLKKEESSQMMPMLELQFQTIKQVEMDRPGPTPTTSVTPHAGGGLVVISALYGNFDGPEERYVDVTIQVQVMVEDSKLILHREGNYCWLDGFHDPCYGEPKVLKLRYLFLEEVHEAEFDDGDPIFAPLPSHSVKKQQEEDRRKKQWLTASSVIAVPVIAAGLYLYFGRGRGSKVQPHKPTAK